MPRISAPTVREHHAKVSAALVDAAEEIVRAGDQLTAGAVAARAGMSRNSIYRYVDSVDDLRGLVLERHLPGWMAGVREELEAVTHPAEWIRGWCRAHLRQARQTGHAWLMALARSGPVAGGTREAVEDAHTNLQAELTSVWREIVADPSVAEVRTILTRRLVDAGLALLDEGRDFDLVVAEVDHAVVGLLESSA